MLIVSQAHSELMPRGHGGMVDATDLKSVDRKVVRVQVPLPPSQCIDSLVDANLWGFREDEAVRFRVS